MMNSGENETIASSRKRAHCYEIVSPDSHPELCVQVDTHNIIFYIKPVPDPFYHVQLMSQV